MEEIITGKQGWGGLKMNGKLLLKYNYRIEETLEQVESALEVFLGEPNHEDFNKKYLISAFKSLTILRDDLGLYTLEKQRAKHAE